MIESFTEGTNEEMLEARRLMPEPARFHYPVYKVPVRREAPLFLDDPFSLPISYTITTVTFERVLVQTREGSTFWCWKCARDGFHYL